MCWNRLYSGPGSRSIYLLEVVVMRSEQNTVRQQGLFFMFLAAGSLAILLGSLASGQWASALLWVPVAFAFGLLVWRAVRSSLSRRRPGGTSPEQTGAGRPVPVKPTPTHHLVAAKAMPPTD